MTQQTPRFAQYAGRVLFPRTLFDLQTTQSCPACFTPLSSALCRSCTLDLSHSAATELAEVSREAALLLEQRTEIIGRIRYETSAAVAAAATGIPVQSAPGSSVAATVAATSAVNATATTTAATAAAASPVAAEPTVAVTAQTPDRARTTPIAPLSAPRRLANAGSTAGESAEATTGRLSGIQLFLLLGGITLLSLAAIAFLVFAFVNSGLVLRSIIIAAFTAAMFVLASFLRRRSLGGTAEGIAVFASVLIYLDAWAVRGNNLAGAATVDGAVYWGAVLIISALGFIAWHRLSGLRAPSIVAFATFVPGAALLTHGLLTTVPGTTIDSGVHTYVVLLVASIAGLSHRAVSVVSGPRTIAARARAGVSERVLTLAAATVALTIAAFVAPWVPFENAGGGAIWGSSFWSGTFALLGVAAVALILCISLARVRAGLTGFVHYLAALGAVTLAASTYATALHPSSIEFAAIVPLAAAVCAMGILDVVRHRARSRGAEWAARVLGTATASAGVTAAIIAITPVVASVYSVFAVAIRSVTTRLWSVPLTDSLRDTDSTFSRGLLDFPVLEHSILAVSILALVVAVALLIVFSALAGRLSARAIALAVAVAGIAVAAVPLTSAVWATSGAWFLIAAIGIVVWGTWRRRAVGGLRAALSTVALCAGLSALALGYAASWASVDSWIAGTAVAVLGLLIVRWTLGPAAVGRRTALTLVTTIVVFIAAWAFPYWYTFGEGTLGGVAAFNGARTVSIVSVAVLLLIAVLPPRLFARAERRSVYWVAGFTALATVSITHARGGVTVDTLLSEPITGLCVTIALLAAVSMWAFSPVSRQLIPERATATILAVPTLSVAVEAAMAVFISGTAPLGGAGGSGGAVAILLAPAIATALGAALSLTLAFVRPLAGFRVLRDVGVALVGAWALLSLAGHPSLWIALVILAIAAFLVAIDTSGLFASSSLRKHVGWLALLLATSALWTVLRQSDLTAPEPYVLPLAGALLLIALFVWRATRDSGELTWAVPALTLSGLIVGIVPIAFVAADGPELRAVLVGLFSAALFITASFVRPASELFRDAVAFAGLLGVAIVTIGRSLTLLGSPNVPGPQLDVVIAFGAITLAIAAWGRFDPSIRTWFAAASMTVPAVVVIASLANHSASWGEAELIAQARALALVVALGTVYVVATARNAAPLTRLLGQGAIGLAALGAGIGFSTGALFPLEMATLPVAIALVVAGAITMRSTPETRSWPSVGVGLLLILIPSLLATIVDRPLWRVIAIAVVAIVFVIVGRTAHLQAPFVIGTIVILVHGIATLSPQIRAVFEAGGWLSWIVVAALGGTILTVFAARTEKSVRTARNAIARIAQLR